MPGNRVKFGLTLPNRGVVIGATTVAEMLQLATDAEFGREGILSTMRARSTCLRGRLRSATIAANCSRSAALKTTHTCCPMAHPPKPSPSIAYPNAFVNPLNDSKH